MREHVGIIVQGQMARPFIASLQDDID